MEPYAPHFEYRVGKIQDYAMLLWSRFDRLGRLPLELISSNFDPIRDMEHGSEKVFRDFTNNDIALIQFGWLVLLQRSEAIYEGVDKKPGTSLGGRIEQYCRLNDWFIGNPLIADYVNAWNGHNQFDPEEIYQVADDYEWFTVDFDGKLDAMKKVFATRTAIFDLIGTKPPQARDQSDPSQEPIPQEIDQIPEGPKTLDETVETTTQLIEKVDRYLLSKI